MATDSVNIQMFGSFDISYGENTISDRDDRAHRVWQFLAYMIYRREETVLPEELAKLYWGLDELSADPLNAIKTILHRGRALLNKLGDDMGRTLITRTNGALSWNTEVPYTLDIEEFLRHCRAGQATRGKERLNHYLNAISLYRGDFLPKQCMDAWVVPIATFYRNLFLETALECIHMLEEQGQLLQAVSISRQAVAIDPYNEEFYRLLMQDLLAIGDQQGVVEVYDSVSDLLFSNFGVMPSEALRELYREAIRTVNDHSITPETLREQLREGGKVSGTMICEYDFFRVLYHSKARSVSRSGDVVHLCLLTVTGREGGVLSRSSLDRIMENLKDVLRGSLRRGDAAAQCSVSQYVIMLPRANYESSCRIGERIVRNFNARYPHAPAELETCVLPLEAVEEL